MSIEPRLPSSYAAAGVDTDAVAVGLGGLLDWVRKTREFREGSGAYESGGAFFASVLRLTDRMALAISTDGVGSKAVVAQMAGRYEGLGYDCVAVNVNDIICVGAEPVALVDYISAQEPHADLLTALGKGLHDGAARAGVAIVGGELSLHPDALTGPRQGYAFDISGTALGLLEGRAPILGADVRPGDVVLGMPSSGIHANGLTLARAALLGDGPSALERNVAGLGHTLGEELLRPTHIYVPEVKALLRADIDIHGLAHISGDGLLNLTRLEAQVGYVIDALPPLPPVFEMIRDAGQVDIAEMFRVFNMGVGFCVVVAPRDAGAAIRAIRGAGGEAQHIGTVVGGERRVEVEPYHLLGADGHFHERGG